MKRLRNILFILISLVLIILTVDALIGLDFLHEIPDSFGDITEVDLSKLPEASNPMLP